MKARKAKVNAHLLQWKKRETLLENRRARTQTLWLALIHLKSLHQSVTETFLSYLTRPLNCRLWYKLHIWSTSRFQRLMKGKKDGGVLANNCVVK